VAGQRHLDPDFCRHRRQPASAIGGLLELVRTGAMSICCRLFIVVLVILVTYFVVFVERGQRKILVNYARRQVGNKVYGGQSSHLPLKLNMAGVIPPIFASSIILLPATVVGWFSTGESMRWLKDIAGSADAGATDLCDVLCSGDRFLLLLLYGAGVQQPRDGRQPEEERRVHSLAFVPATRRRSTSTRSWSADAGRCDLHHVCVPAARVSDPEVQRAVLFWWYVVADHCVVTMDFMAQVQNYMMSQQYESLLKKANFKSSWAVERVLMSKDDVIQCRVRW
jgi:preprotein translocase subunit SecY